LRQAQAEAGEREDRLTTSEQEGREALEREHRVAAISAPWATADRPDRPDRVTGRHETVENGMR